MAETTRRRTQGSRSGAGDGERTHEGPGRRAPRDGTVSDADVQAPVCSVAFCPFCMLVTALGEARPELVEHLLLAGREMLLAARAVIDTRLETMEEREKGSRIERISIE
jgi:hypothetical protein